MAVAAAEAVAEADAEATAAAVAVADAEALAPAEAVACSVAISVFNCVDRRQATMRLWWELQLCKHIAGHSIGVQRHREELH